MPVGDWFVGVRLQHHVGCKIVYLNCCGLMQVKIILTQCMKIIGYFTPLAKIRGKNSKNNKIKAKSIESDNHFFQDPQR